MSRETLIKGDKTILNTDYYLYLLSCEDKLNQLVKFLEFKIKIYENRVMEHGFDDDLIRLETYQDILERVKGGKYDS